MATRVKDAKREPCCRHVVDSGEVSERPCRGLFTAKYRGKWYCPKHHPLLGRIKWSAPTPRSGEDQKV